jgi:hypothetical protein
MKLEIARGLFLVTALGVASLAAAAWHEPGPAVLNQAERALHCPLPRKAPLTLQQVAPDRDLLLFMFGLSQGMGPQS